MCRINMKNILIHISVALMICTATVSCNNNKIACPTYADSFPNQKKKKQTEPQIPKSSKVKSGVLPK